MLTYLIKITQIVHSFLSNLLSIRFLVTILVTCLGVSSIVLPARADSIDPYIRRYLKVTEPVALEMDSEGHTRLFSPEQLFEGKRLFQEHCLNCHVGGATLPVPSVSLSLNDLKGATPPRDTIDGLVGYLRKPMTYDGSEETYWCREVPDTWMPTEQVETLAAFILRAAQEAPGWGTNSFDF